MEYLRIIIDAFLDEWFNSKNKKPLIIKGARQIGKTKSIEEFAKRNKLSLVEINFVLNPEYRDVFDDGHKVDKILENISLKDPSLEFIPGKTSSSKIVARQRKKKEHLLKGRESHRSKWEIVLSL